MAIFDFLFVQQNLLGRIFIYTLIRLDFKKIIAIILRYQPTREFACYCYEGSCDSCKFRRYLLNRFATQSG